MTLGTRMMSVKLFGGPMGGRMIDVPASAERFRVGRGVGFWTYTWAGRDGQQVMFAIQPASRVERRFISQHIRRTGKHPLVELEFFKQRPLVGRAPRRQRARRRPRDT